MRWPLSPFSVALWLGAAITLGVAWMSWRRRSARGGNYLLWASLSLACYVGGYAFELSSATLADIRFWLKVEYLGVTLAPVMLLALILTYTDYGNFLTPPRLILLLLIPTATLVLAWTNEQHRLIWQNLAFTVVGGSTITTFTPGSWYWIHAGNSWALLLIGIVLLIRELPRTSGVYRRQTVFMLLGALLPLPVYGLYLTHVLPIRIDLNPFALSLTSIFFAIAVFRYQLLDVMPIARDAIWTRLTDAIVVLDPHNRIVDVNHVARQLSGLQNGSAIGRPAEEVLAGWGDMLTRYRDALEAHDELTVTVHGEPHVFDLRLSSLLSEGGKVAGRMFVLRDISARVQAQNALREANERLTALRRVDMELSRRLNLGYVLNIALDAALRISGADAGFILLVSDGGAPMVQAVGHESPEDLEHQARQGITGRVLGSGQAELVLDVAADADYVAIVPGTRAQISAPLISHEKRIGVLTLETATPQRFTPDVFESVRLLAARVALAIDNAQMYEEREKLVAELRAFAHTVAHDLKNPISVITGYASMLVDHLDEVPPQERRDFAERIQRGARKSTDIINSLLLLAGAHSSNKVGTELVNMTAVVEEVRRSLASQLDSYQATLNAPDEWPMVEGYRPWIEQVWTNYLTNALKYGGKPPCIEMGFTKLEDDMIRFWVQDNGEGLPPEAQAALFRPFTRLEQHYRQEGHGLGLSIVQRIVERLGGEVGVESEVGQGSIFYFTLPAAPAV